MRAAKDVGAAVERLVETATHLTSADVELLRVLVHRAYRPGTVVTEGESLRQAHLNVRRHFPDGPSPVPPEWTLLTTVADIGFPDPIPVLMQQRTRAYMSDLLAALVGGVRVQTELTVLRRPWDSMLESLESHDVHLPGRGRHLAWTVELTRVRLEVGDSMSITSLDGLREVLLEWGIADRAQESLWVITFDARHRMRSIAEVVRGNYHHAEVGMATILSAVFLTATDSFWLVHNHPSGSTVPSAHDLALTWSVCHAAEISGLRFEDHWIVTPEGELRSVFDDARSEPWRHMRAQ